MLALNIQGNPTSPQVRMERSDVLITYVALTEGYVQRVVKTRPFIRLFADISAVTRDFEEIKARLDTMRSRLAPVDVPLYLHVASSEALTVFFIRGWLREFQYKSAEDYCRMAGDKRGKKPVRRWIPALFGVRTGREHNPRGAFPPPRPGREARQFVSNYAVRDVP
jgi:hypothetical protein